MRTLSRAAAVALLLGGLATCSMEPVFAREPGNFPAPSDEFLRKAEELARWIDENSDFGPMPSHPAYVFMPLDQMHYLYYQSAGINYTGQTDALQAMYHDGIMYLGDGIDPSTEGDAAILLHELVHHLQFLEGREYRCIGASEVPAYEIQAKYLAAIESDLYLDPLGVMIATSCPNDWED